MKTIGSQTQESLEEAGYSIAGRINENEVVLVDKTGKYELWRKSNAASYVVMINLVPYEFVRTALTGDLWWAHVGHLPAICNGRMLDISDGN